MVKMRAEPLITYVETLNIGHDQYPEANQDGEDPHVAADGGKNVNHHSLLYNHPF